ncbi:hypothetical protein UFOVP1290_55 [uncultured Caudovirales phage]|uniref:Uncharacterized protein n=1 Tax=uncultured Caudovirales phage TaxID=2100421 RepID=A0A6J5RWB0_9CAUD|nr:hypothetical protein UFOVP1290_55 [uncultured Caudovirales phage]
MADEQENTTNETSTVNKQAVLQTEKISEIDRLSLDLSKTKRELALSDAKTAIANSEKAELSYRYFILKLYMKYNLTESDAITEGGDIIRGGANFVKTGS